MAMSDEKIVEALREMRARVQGPKGNWPPERLSPEDMTRRINTLDPPDVAKHLVFMCDEAERMLKEGRREKVMRWLGFIQGALWGRGVTSIAEAKDANKPDDPKPDEPKPSVPEGSIFYYEPRYGSRRNVDNVCEGCGKFVGDCSCGEASSGGTPHHPSGRAYYEEEWEQFNK